MRTLHTVAAAHPPRTRRAPAAHPPRTRRSTRSLGDGLGKLVGVSAVPEVYEIPVSDRTAYLLLCSDGITDVISDQE
eukprot:2230548-Prymnesium_polylepis.1